MCQDQRKVPLRGQRMNRRTFLFQCFNEKGDLFVVCDVQSLMSQDSTQCRPVAFDSGEFKLLLFKKIQNEVCYSLNRGRERINVLSLTPIQVEGPFRLIEVGGACSVSSGNDLCCLLRKTFLLQGSADNFHA